MSKAIHELLSRQAQDEADADTKRRHALLVEEEFKRREQPFVEEVLDRIRRAVEFNNSHPLRKEELVVAPDIPNQITVQTTSARAKTLHVGYDTTQRRIFTSIKTVTFPNVEPMRPVNSYTLMAGDGGIVAVRGRGDGIAQGYATDAEEIADEIMTAFLKAKAWSPF